MQSANDIPVEIFILKLIFLLSHSFTFCGRVLAPTRPHEPPLGTEAQKVGRNAMRPDRNQIDTVTMNNYSKKNLQTMNWYLNLLFRIFSILDSISETQSCKALSN